jgi:hypothetical protein
MLIYISSFFLKLLYDMNCTLNTKISETVGRHSMDLILINKIWSATFVFSEISKCKHYYKPKLRWLSLTVGITFLWNCFLPQLEFLLFFCIFSINPIRLLSKKNWIKCEPSEALIQQNNMKNVSHCCWFLC